MEVSAVAAGGVLCDGQGEHAVDVDAVLAGKVEPEPRGRVLVSVEDAAKVVTQCGIVACVIGPICDACC